MSKKIKITLIIITCVLSFGFTYVFTYVPSFPKHYGIVEAKLFLGEAEKQPLIVAFGGGGGENDWNRKYLKAKRDSLINMRYEVVQKNGTLFCIKNAENGSKENQENAHTLRA